MVSRKKKYTENPVYCETGCRDPMPVYKLSVDNIPSKRDRNTPIIVYVYCLLVCYC